MTKQKPIIAIDLDDVVSSQIEVFIAYYNQTYDAHITMEDFMLPGGYQGYFEKTVAKGLSPEEAITRFQDFLQKMEPLKQGIPKETLQALGYLKENFRLEIVTARGADYEKPTIAWLKKHAPDIFDNVHFLELWDEADNKATKALVCQKIGAGYLIDDSPAHCNIAAETGVSALLFGEYGWNIAAEVHAGVTRCKDWPAVLEYFDGQK